ncbi:MAG: GspMb/PilO family protein [Planctomycetota bacterium]
MSHRERTLFIVTVGVIALVIVYFALVNPALDKWSEIQKRDAKILERQRDLAFLIGSRPALVDEIHEMEELITSSAPETMEADFHAHLNKVAEASRVTPSAVRMVKTQPLRDDFEEIVLSVNLDCDMNCLTDYLVSLERKSSRLIKISRLDISRSPKRRGRNEELGVNMVISTVVKSKPEEEKESGGAHEGE